ncbi:putative ascorbate peroxidase [Clytia hemisphaerica]|uniref:Plant heme peroxidase family profile domain-containing protein n=1 Tax=Clytia hemisphaerica TaxID=252671 RepID=A0A7M5UDV4_9CNID
MMRMLLSLASSLALLCVVHCSLYPSQQDVLEAKVHLDTMIDNTIINNNEKLLIAGFVRLAFHDCVGAGGCDGCIDHNNPSNGGLSFYTSKLNPVWEAHVKGKMSRADFYMLAGYVALQHASDELTDQFTAFPKFGRLDCPSTTGDEDISATFPKATWNLPEASDFFADNFQFSVEETVVILGAHTLGRCRLANSGFEGRWVKGSVNNIPQTDMLNNEYYKQIRGNWTQKQTSEGKWQWQRPGTTANTDFEQLRNSKNQPNMFLNVDMAIAWDLDSNGGLDTDNGLAQCVVEVEKNQCIATPSAPCCNKADTNIGPVRQGNNLFLKYVNDNAVFVSKFSEVFVKMTEIREVEELQDVFNSNDAFERKDEGKRVHHHPHHPQHHARHDHPHHNRHHHGNRRIEDQDDEDEDIEEMLYDFLHN